MSALISYLVPSYNHAQYVTKMLDSIKQDIHLLASPAEIVILDDASTDNSIEVIQNWIDNNHNLEITFLSQNRNLGIAASLNKLVAHAQGTFLRLTSSDDILIAGSTQYLLDNFTSESLLCVLGDGEIIDERDKIIYPSSISFHKGRTKRLCNTSFLANELIQRWCVAGPSFLIKKCHLEKIKYNEKEKIDDYQLFLSLLEIPDSILFVDTKVCLYRMHRTNTSKTKDINCRVNNLNSYLAVVMKYINREKLRHLLLPVYYKTKAKIYFLEKNYYLCFLNLIKAIWSARDVSYFT